MNRGQLVIELVAIADDAHKRGSFAKHAALLILDAADYVAQSLDGHARISLRVAERVLGESALALDVQQLHDTFVELLLTERQHAPLPTSMYTGRLRIVKPDRYADGVAHSVAKARAWTDADDLAALAETYS